MVIPFNLQASPAGDIATQILEDTAVEAKLINSADNALNIFEISGFVINIVLGFVGIIFLVLIIAGGYMWMTAGGNDEKVTKRKSLLTQSIIALAVILSAFLLTNFVIIRLMTNLWG
ncbi:hypothetical protein HOG11_00195 [bacterium]|nr:hypothetical protein [bacterium]